MLIGSGYTYPSYDEELVGFKKPFQKFAAGRGPTTRPTSQRIIMYTFGDIGYEHTVIYRLIIMYIP
jgi:hypothetical protein